MKKYYLPEKLSDYKEKRIIDVIEKVIASRPGNIKKILKTDLFEENFGIMGISSFLAKISGSLSCIDISEHICDRASGFFNEKRISADILAADVRALPFADKAFDLIISPSTLDHFPELDQAVNECLRVLSDNAAFVLILNNANNILFRLNSMIFTLLRLHDFKNYHYKIEDIKDILSGHDIHIESTKYIVHIPFFLPTIVRVNEFLGLGFVNRAIIRIMKNYSENPGYFARYTAWYICVVSRRNVPKIC